MPRISSYPTKGTPTSSDFALIADVADNNETKKATLGTILTGAAITAGTPSSALTAGTAGELQYDATNIYICTTTGTATNAIWKKVTLAGT